MNIVLLGALVFNNQGTNFQISLVNNMTNRKLASLKKNEKRNKSMKRY